MLAHKRALSSGEVSAPKRPAPNFSGPDLAAFDPRLVYIVTRDSRDPYAGDDSQVLEAYATAQDANWGLKGLCAKEGFGEEDGEESYDISGLLTFTTEGEGEEIEWRVQRIRMRPAGTVTPPESEDEDEQDGDDEGGGQAESEEEDDGGVGDRDDQSSESGEEFEEE